MHSQVKDKLKLFRNTQKIFLNRYWFTLQRPKENLESYEIHFSDKYYEIYGLYFIKNLPEKIQSLKEINQI